MNNVGKWAMVNGQWAKSLSFRVVQRLIPRWLTQLNTRGTAERNKAPVSLLAPSALDASRQ
jgi:hypothetical protein